MPALNINLLRKTISKICKLIKVSSFSSSVVSDYDKCKNDDIVDIVTTCLALTNAVGKLHKRDYLHMDIKPENFIAFDDHTKKGKNVALFDMDTFISLNEINNGTLKGVSYSEDWAAPEVKSRRFNKLSPATDIFSIGVVLFERIMKRMLFIKQCNKLHDILPGLFEETNDYTEVLLNISFTDKDGVVYHLVHDIAEDDFNVEKEGQVEIIGWMYQYYNIEPKDKVFANLKKNIKISKENIPAATQLFTPDWIVRYMVENSLGKLWLEGHPNDAMKAQWKYYLEEAEQEPQVAAQLELIRAEYKNLTPEGIKFIDPCMGSGHILVYAFDVFMQIYESYGYTQRDAVRSILLNNIYGLDIDDRAYQLSYFAIMMKARQYNRRIFRESITPNLFAIRESNQVTHDLIEFVANGDKKLLSELTTVCHELRDAKEYGSILNITPVDFDGILSRIDAIAETYYDDIFLQDYQRKTLSVIVPLIKQAKAMAQKYDVVVTNPPYMPLSNAHSKLSDYVKDNYPDSKTDLFAVFIERCKEMLKKYGYQAMITMHSWMFLSSYEKLRKKLMLNDTINMAHLGARAFEEIGGEVVQTTAFIRRNSYNKEYLGVYCRLVEPNTQQGKEIMFLEKKNRFTSNQNNFSKIPGSPIAYWVSENFLKTFDNAKISELCEIKQGLATCNNALFLRNWSEAKYVI